VFKIENKSICFVFVSQDHRAEKGENGNILFSRVDDWHRVELERVILSYRKEMETPHLRILGSDP
jgi:hypothetical protein